MFKITEEAILPELAVNDVKKEAYGCVASFIGLVRRHSKGKRVLYLEFNAHKETVEEELRELSDEIKAKWGLADVALYHRVGQLKVEETCLVVAVAAPHRREAFEACQYAVDRLKQIFTEKEVFENNP